jgi:hypothetical protein
MKSFKEFVHNDNHHDFHHTSIHGKLETDKDYPIWLSHNRHQARGWHTNSKLQGVDGSKTKTFKVKLKHDAKIAQYKDESVKKHLAKYGVDAQEYSADMACNASKKDVDEHPGTIALKNAGYHGITHDDYNPHNFQKDHDSTLLFDRSKIHKHYTARKLFKYNYATDKYDD